jgi:hypothetical protein
LQQHHLLLRSFGEQTPEPEKNHHHHHPTIIVTITIAAAKAWWVFAWIAAFSRVPLCCAAADGRTDQQCA